MVSLELSSIKKKYYFKIIKIIFMYKYNKYWPHLTCLCIFFFIDLTQFSSPMDTKKKMACHTCIHDISFLNWNQHLSKYSSISNLEVKKIKGKDTWSLPIPWRLYWHLVWKLLWGKNRREKRGMWEPLNQRSGRQKKEIGNLIKVHDLNCDEIVLFSSIF